MAGPVLSRPVTGGHSSAVLVLAAAALALGGCSLLAPPKPPVPVAQLPLPLPPLPPRPPPAPAAPLTGSAAAAGRLARPPAEPPSAPLQVVGLSQDAVRRLLGPPAAETAQGPSQTWTYQGAGCRVDIAFYYDVTRSGFFALSEQRAGGGEAAECLARIHDTHLS